VCVCWIAVIYIKYCCLTLIFVPLMAFESLAVRINQMHSFIYTAQSPTEPLLWPGPIGHLIYVFMIINKFRAAVENYFVLI
jgi:hypothetical protein